MPRQCSVCVRRDVGKINGQLTSGRSARSVALEFGILEDTVQRHAAKGHIGRIQAIPLAKVAKAPMDPLDELVTTLRQAALESGARNPAMVHQYRLALIAKEAAEHSAPDTRDLASEPEWIDLRSKMLAALEPYPAARIAVAEALA